MYLFVSATPVEPWILAIAIAQTSSCHSCHTPQVHLGFSIYHAQLVGVSPFHMPLPLLPLQLSTRSLIPPSLYLVVPPLLPLITYKSQNSSFSTPFSPCLDSGLCLTFPCGTPLDSLPQILQSQTHALLQHCLHPGALLAPFVHPF